MVECQLPKLEVAGSNPVIRSNKNSILRCCFSYLSPNLGAGGGTRTRTSLRTLGPESSESTNSTTPAIGLLMY